MRAEPAPLVPGPRRPLVEGGGPPPGSARRTTTIDTHRPVDPPGPATVTLRGRDITVDENGSVTVEATASLEAVIDEQGILAELTSAGPGPAPDRIGALVGASLRAGFGGLVARTLPDEVGARTLAGVLLEDLSGGYFVSGTVLVWAGADQLDPDGLELVSQMQGDVCTGWQRHAQQHVHMLKTHTIASPGGAPAPDLAATAGPDGWHRLEPLEPGTHRRARRLDLIPAPMGTGGSGGGRRLEAHFRDSVADDEGERVLHEYRVDAGVDSEDRLTDVTATALVLPWSECPGAAASAGWASGQHLADLPSFMRREMVGVKTCTHLNTTVRALADAAALAERVAAAAVR